MAGFKSSRLFSQLLQNEAVQYKAQIDLLVGLGKVIITFAAKPSEVSPQSPLEEDLNSVSFRYDKVWKRLETRNVALETTVLQMEKYRRLVRNISIFITRTEKRLGQLEAVGGDSDTIRKQISEHKVGFALYGSRLLVSQCVVVAFSFYDTLVQNRARVIYWLSLDHIYFLLRRKTRIRS